jgi:Uma2 family endonuclease
MQAIQRVQAFIPQEEYLATERASQERHEWYQGECFAMAGGTRWHNLLAGKIYAACVQHLAGQACTPYMADLRLYIESHQHYVYPDMLVVCQPEAYIADDMVNDATIIIEVLSPTTESYDRGRKFLHYQSLPSLREFVLISQQSIQVEIFRRKPTGKWEYECLTQRSSTLTLETINYSISLEELYRDIALKKTERQGE